MSEYRVRAVACDHQSSDEEVYRALRRATDPLSGSWERIANATRIGIKFNQDWAPDRVIMRHGQRQQLVSDAVVRATIRILREHTDAHLFVTDVGVEGSPPWTRAECTTILPVLNELGVPYVDGNKDETRWVDVPGGGLMFDRYPLPAASVEADAFISVQKMKNHRFMGVTLSLKNLFGLMALPPAGRPRTYYHHLVRLPYVLADLGRIYRPALSILDGMVCQAGEEWGPGEHARDANVLVAGDHTVATDAVVTHLMGHDPRSDWPVQPFIRDRNHLLAAAEGGFGTVDLAQIDLQTEVSRPLGEFFCLETDPPATVRAWLRTTAEQARFYQQHRERLVSEYAGRYIMLQRGEVRWTSTSGRLDVSRREIAGEHPDDALWLKYVDPEEAEGERFDVYERALELVSGVPPTGR